MGLKEKAFKLRFAKIGIHVIAYSAQQQKITITNDKEKLQIH